MTYLVIIECSPAALRTHVFLWEGNDVSTLHAVNLEKTELHLVVKPGLSANDSAQTVAIRLAPILKELQYLLEPQMPSIEPGSVPVYLLGNGLQDAEVEARGILLENGLNVVKKFSYFKTRTGKSHAIVPSADDLQVFAWVALHFDKNLSMKVPFEVFASGVDKPAKLVYHDESNQLNVILEYLDWKESLPLLTSTTNLFLGAAALIIKNGMSFAWNMNKIHPLPPLEFALDGSLKMTSWTDTTTPSWGTSLFHQISHLRKDPDGQRERRLASKDETWMAAHASNSVIPIAKLNEDKALGDRPSPVEIEAFKELEKTVDLPDVVPDQTAPETAQKPQTVLPPSELVDSVLRKETEKEAVPADSIRAIMPPPLETEEAEEAVKGHREDLPIQDLIDGIGDIFDTAIFLENHARLGESAIESISLNQPVHEENPDTNTTVTHTTQPAEVEDVSDLGLIALPFSTAFSSALRFFEVLAKVSEEQTYALVDELALGVLGHPKDAHDLKLVMDLPEEQISALLEKVATQDSAFVLNASPSEHRKITYNSQDIPRPIGIKILTRAEIPGLPVDFTQWLTIQNSVPIPCPQLMFILKLKTLADVYDEILANGDGGDAKSATMRAFDYAKDDVVHLLQLLESGSALAFSFSEFHSGTNLSESVMTLGQYLLAPSQDEGSLGGLALWRRILSALDQMHLAELADMEIPRLLQLSE